MYVAHWLAAFECSALRVTMTATPQTPNNEVMSLRTRSMAIAANAGSNARANARPFGVFVRISRCASTSTQRRHVRGAAMVFFRRQMSHTVRVHPQFLGPALREYVRGQLQLEVEGMSLDETGFIVSVL